MAKTPKDSKNGKKPEKTRDLEQEMLMREVDEAVRTDDVTGALRRYGLPVGSLLIAGLLAFAAYLYWDDNQELALEGQSEIIITAMDELAVENVAIADQELSTVDGEISPGALSSANMIRAAIALEEGRIGDAVAFYDQIVRNEAAPQPMRDISQIRLVAANYDNMEPQEVIDRLGPLAVAGNPWFGSAGEMVAHAYLDQDMIEQAGPLLVEIAQSDDVPETLKVRVGQLAGRYGYDAIEDVDETLETLVSDSAEGATE